MSLTTMASTTQCIKYGDSIRRVKLHMDMNVHTYYAHAGFNFVVALVTRTGETFLKKEFGMHAIDSASFWMDKQVNDYLSWK